jgi:orotidine-5'-phosphate decarboxylase
VVGAPSPAARARGRARAPHLRRGGRGVGAPGGDAAATVAAGWRANAPIIVNSSRAVLYASAGADFADAARRVALATRAELNAARAVRR